MTKPLGLKNLFKKVAISSVVLASLTIGSASAESEISTVYHVYLNGERVGTIDNETAVTSVVQQKIDELRDTYKDLDLVPENLSFVPEQVFHQQTNNTETANKVAEEVKIVANAAALVIDEKSVAYLDDEEQANEAIKQLKLKYVDEDVLSKIESDDYSKNDLKPLEEGQSRIIDVTLSKKVSVSEEKINPEDVLSIEEAVKLLQKGTLEEKVYKVKEGDVLGSIAVDHDLETKELLALNPDIKEEDFLKIGQKINVTELKPYLTVVTEIEEFKKETIDYKTEVKENSSMYKGDQKVTQEGKEGKKLVNYLVTKTNGQTTKQEKIKEEIVNEPVTKIIEKGTKVVPSRGSGSLAWPAVGGYISSKQGYRWGAMHKGIDIARPSDRTIKAADNGTIVSAGYDGGYGNKVVINHNNGLKTVYAHLSSISVSVGQTVEKGQKIGVMGTTGNSTGIHLHFEVYKNGSLQNPLNYVGQ